MFGHVMHQMRLRQRLLLVVGLVFVLALAGAVTTARWYTNTLRERIDHERLMTTTSLAGELDRLIIEATATLRLAATAPEPIFEAGGLDRIASASTVFTASRWIAVLLRAPHSTPRFAVCAHSVFPARGAVH